METHARYFLVGLFSLAVTAGLIVFVLWLGKLQLDRDYQNYEIRFRESVTGLSVGGIVQYQGVQVGEVRKLSLDPEDPRVVRALVRVAAATPVKTDTQAQLSYTGLTGVAVVELFGGTPEAVALREADGRSTPAIDAIPSSLSQLVSGGRGAVHSAEQVLARIDTMLDDRNLERVSNLLANLESISASIVDDYPGFRAALSDARVLERRLDTAVRRADDLLSQMQRQFGTAPGDASGGMFGEMRAAIADVRSAAAAFARFSDSGERAMSGVDGAARAELVSTLQALQHASESLARITLRFDQAPVDYLRGAQTLPVYSPEGEAK
jgi:phospholipid/cholesterol/gamma-HCH transport system substrate-binding protein